MTADKLLRTKAQDSYVAPGEKDNSGNCQSIEKPFIILINTPYSEERQNLPHLSKKNMESAHFRSIASSSGRMISITSSDRFYLNSGAEVNLHTKMGGMLPMDAQDQRQTCSAHIKIVAGLQTIRNAADGLPKIEVAILKKSRSQ